MPRQRRRRRPRTKAAASVAKRRFNPLVAGARRSLYREDGELQDHLDATDLLYDGKGRDHTYLFMPTHGRLVKYDDAKRDPSTTDVAAEEPQASTESEAVESVSVPPRALDVNHFVLVAELMSMSAKKLRELLSIVAPGDELGDARKAIVASRLALATVEAGKGLEDLEALLED